MKISCLNTTVLKANNDNRTEKSKNNNQTIPNLPLPIKVKHADKKVKKSIIPGESCKDPKVLNNAVRIEELNKAKTAKAEQVKSRRNRISEVALARRREMQKKKLENLKILLIKMKRH